MVNRLSCLPGRYDAALTVLLPSPCIDDWERLAKFQISLPYLPRMDSMRSPISRYRFLVSFCGDLGWMCISGLIR